ncbi:ATP-dependent DNA helicase [Paenibacillus psychroresistens]|uniref:ATP-dependent DNA helicase n=1 Tax=Paenibacillus psychroresistens TaxID=1778678 RepID=A0A6B8RUG8_9BACL|nr:ATP-dependent DNA helicase [Paenibacillus psychroresistens]QGQ99093.1 ATP-dependent DNA helicase [Paenibacillus psychroresistens]
MLEPIAIAVSVRSLVEYVFRSGSLDSGFRTMSTLAEGTKAHQKVQKQYGELDQKEVSLKAEISHGDLLFVIDGRCDGLLIDENSGVTIDEIKSTARDVERITEDMHPVHWAQAKLYAYMYAIENGNQRIKVQLTYVQVDTEHQKKFEQELRLAELVIFVAELVESYAPYARMVQHNKRLRDESIRELAFPFPAFREGQRKLAGSVFKAIDEGRKLFAKAPTGIGKTVSTLYPAIKAIGAGKAQHLFYLTARTITRTAAEEALALMKAQGLQMSSVTITAKDKICFQENVDCRKEACVYADGYYDRVNAAILDLMSNETLITRPLIEQYARKHTVCPFEFSLDMAYSADAVICDYNYVFDPRISLKRLFGERKQQTVLLVDEAHNLVDRAREMFSAELVKKDFLELEREMKGVHPEVQLAAKVLNKWFIQFRKESTEQSVVTKDKPTALIELVDAFIVQAEKVLAGGGTNEGSPRLLEVYFSALGFQRIGKLYDGNYINYAEIARNEVQLKLFCLNPSDLLRQIGKSYRAHVYFSATLSPLGYYMDILGAEQEDYSITLPTPFAKEQWEVSIVPISTKYIDREHTKAPLVNLLQAHVMEKLANYLIFFPSYEYMNSVYEAFMIDLDHDRVHTLLQRSEMPEEERESFLAAFSQSNDHALVGFAVLGGIFSESIDLVGDRLQGVVVVGVGMPQISLERNLIKAYYDREQRSGFDYAYVYPGINKVLQAGGRLIRSEHDRGTLLLVDDRYKESRYRKLLPAEWLD